MRLTKLTTQVPHTSSPHFFLGAGGQDLRRPVLGTWVARRDQSVHLKAEGIIIIILPLTDFSILPIFMAPCTCLRLIIMLVVLVIVTGIFPAAISLGDQNVQTRTRGLRGQAREELLLLREGAPAKRV